PAEKRAVTVALVGQPNTGKSTVFNMLTGESQHVGNWPGKTVEKKEGRVFAGDKEIYIYDLPGTYSLTANSLEEKIARDFLLKEQCDVVVVVVDAGQLERSLYILAEVVSLGIPVIVALNKMDVAQNRNAVVNPEMFRQKTGLVVIPVTASRHDGITELLEAILHFDSSRTLQSDRFPEINVPHFDAVLQKIQGRFSQGPSAYWLAGKLIEGDEDVAAMLAGQLSSERWQEIQELLPSPEQGQLAMATARYDWIRTILPCLVTSKPAQYRRSGFDIAATHPFWGKTIALAVLFFGVIAAYLIALPLMIPGFAVFFLAEPLQQFLSSVFPLPLCS
ncbi:MAG: ferrous iron transport protein B, partial [Spirochaetales bacterium]